MARFRFWTAACRPFVDDRARRVALQKLVEELDDFLLHGVEPVLVVKDYFFQFLVDLFIFDGLAQSLDHGADRFAHRDDDLARLLDADGGRRQHAHVEEGEARLFGGRFVGDHGDQEPGKHAHEG